MRPKLLNFGALLLASWTATAGPSGDVPSSDINKRAVAQFEALIQAGNYTQAKAALQPYLQEHPDSWRAQYQLGYVDFELHQFADSVAALCKSLVLNRSFPDSHRILAYDLNVIGRQEWAIQELQSAIQLDPGSADSHYELGRIYYERSAYSEAVTQLIKARTIAPDSVRVYHNLGLAYSAVGENAKAVECFEEALRRNTAQTKPSPWPLIDYATYLNLRERFEQARSMLLQAIEIDQHFSQAFDALSKAYRGLGQTSEAIDALKHAVELDPQKAEFHYVLARLYNKSHQPTKAQAELAAYQRSLSEAGGR